jgi:hypothetical protein
MLPGKINTVPAAFVPANFEEPVVEKISQPKTITNPHYHG